MSPSSTDSSSASEGRASAADPPTATPASSGEQSVSGRRPPNATKDETSSVRGARTRYVDVLAHVSQIVSSSHSLDLMLKGTISLIRTMVEIERCSIMLIDPSEKVLRLRASSQIPSNEWDTIKIPVGEGISGCVAQNGKPLLVSDISSSTFATKATEGGRYETHSFICVPLIVKGRTIGVINANNVSDKRKFGRDDLELLTALAGLMALSIENARLLADSETTRSHLEKIVDSLPVGIVALDLRQRVTLSNRRLLTLIGADREHATDGRRLQEVFPSEVHQPLEEMVADSTTYHVDSRRELELPRSRTKAGDGVPVELATTPLSDSKGDVNGILVTVQDLSMRRELDELRRLDEMKSNFMALVSHELRTPLTSILGAVHLLLQPPLPQADQPSEPQRRLLGIVDTNANRLSKLVADLLDMVQVEAGSLDVTRRDEALAPILEQAAAPFVALAQARGITFILDVRPANAYVDKVRLTQALSHLLDNAMKFTARGGRVELSLVQADNRVVMTVRDTGAGVSPDAHARLFTKFFQAQNPLTRSCGGTGIGLFLAKAIVDLHGGTISATEGLRDGAEFKVELPVY